MREEPSDPRGRQEARNHRQRPKAKAPMVRVTERARRASSGRCPDAERTDTAVDVSTGRGCGRNPGRERVRGQRRTEACRWGRRRPPSRRQDPGAGSGAERGSLGVDGQRTVRSGRTVRTQTEAAHRVGGVHRREDAPKVGGLQSFPSDDQLAQFAGLTGPAAQSGSLTREARPLARTGHAYLRDYLVEDAHSVWRHDSPYAADYAKKVAESPQIAHRRALVLAARTLARLVFARLRDDRAYNPEHQSALPIGPPNRLPKPSLAGPGIL